MSKARPNPQAESLGYWVFRLHRALHAAFGDRLAALGVTPSEWTALSQAGGGAVTPVALAARMGIDRAAVTRIVDQLERKKLVRRTPHPADGRSTVLVLTAGGRSLLPKLVQASRETNRSFLSVLPPADAAALLVLLRRLGESLPQQVFPFEADET